MKRFQHLARYGVLGVVVALIVASNAWGEEQNSRDKTDTSGGSDSVTPISREDATGLTACPVEFLGRMDGIWYYLCQRCDNCEQIIADSSTPHAINYKCQSCNEPGCSDPFVSHSPPKGGQPFFGEIGGIDSPASEGSGSSEGSSAGSRGRFEPGSDVEIQSEHFARLEYKGKDRLIHLFALKVQRVEGTTVVGIGQEVSDGTQKTSLRAERLSGIEHAHRIRIPGVDLDFEVLTSKK